MSLLEYENNKDDYCKDITYRQLIGKQISYKPYRRIASFNGYFLKDDFFIYLLVT